MNRLAATLTIAFVALCGSAARADLAGHIEPQFFGGSASVRNACLLLANTRPAPDTAGHAGLHPSAAEIAECLQLIRRVLLPPGAAGTTGSIQQDVPARSLRVVRHRQLLSTYRAVQQLEPWVNWSADRPGASALAADLIAVEADARGALESEELLGGKYDAVIRVGFLDARPGGYAGRPPDAPDRGTLSVPVNLDVETEHMGLGRGWDFALVFDAGRRPLLVMVKTTNASTVAPAYLEGLTTSTGFRYGHASASTETSLLAHVGGARLSPASTVVGSGAGTAVLAANDAAEWALFFDAGVDFKWYARDVWLAHLATQSLDPLFHIYAGVKHDQRFHRSGDLEGFNDPTGRIAFGFDVMPVRVAGGCAGGIGNTLFSFGGGFAFEGSIRETNRLPSGFRFGVAGNLDLVKSWRARRKSIARSPCR